MAWLLLPAGLALAFGFAPMVSTLTLIASLLAMFVAVPFALVTGEVRPAVALAVLGLPSLMTMWATVEVASTSAALALIALAFWAAVRSRRGRGRGAAGPPPSTAA